MRKAGENTTPAVGLDFEFPLESRGDPESVRPVLRVKESSPLPVGGAHGPVIGIVAVCAERVVPRRHDAGGDGRNFEVGGNRAWASGDLVGDLQNAVPEAVLFMEGLGVGLGNLILAQGVGVQAVVAAGTVVDLA